MSGSSRARQIVLALFGVAVLLGRPAAADVDMTGTWRVETPGSERLRRSALVVAGALGRQARRDADP